MKIERIRLLIAPHSLGCNQRSIIIIIKDKATSLTDCDCSLTEYIQAAHACMEYIFSSYLLAYSRSFLHFATFTEEGLFILVVFSASKVSLKYEVFLDIFLTSSKLF
jgi:hypothetical protein